MKVPIVVQPDAGQYLARCTEPTPAEARGGTRFEAVSRLADALRDRLGSDVELLPLEVGPDRPWLASAGSLPDDEQTRAWLAEVARVRAEADLASDGTSGQDPHAPPVAGSPPVSPGAEARP